MKRIILSIGVIGSACILFGADPAGFRVWKSSELQDYSTSLHAKMNKDKIGSEMFGKMGSSTPQISHREADGLAELHQQVDDWFVVESGVAMLQVGGDMVDKKVTAPNEVRGASINGGVKKNLGAGDIVYIPANQPHRLFVEPGKQFTYFVIKVPK
jgi:mannose-6-phosphate isomerase-like protein (cupin superfamily)